MGGTRASYAKRSVARAGQGNLIRAAVHQLGTGQLFDQVGIAAIFFHQGNAMLQPGAAGLKFGELLLLDAQMGLGIFQRKDAAIAPDGLGAEVAHHGQRDRRNDESYKKSADRTLDSHSPNESHTDSPRQEGFS